MQEFIIIKARIISPLSPEKNPPSVCNFNVFFGFVALLARTALVLAVEETLTLGFEVGVSLLPDAWDWDWDWD
jgi:hypothetical protein